MPIWKEIKKNIVNDFFEGIDDWFPFIFLTWFSFTANNSRLLTKSNATITVSVKHLNHTSYSCETPGQVRDDCFICECKNGTVILEHCYESDAESCLDRKPSFLFNKINWHIVLFYLIFWHNFSLVYLL